MNLASQVNVIHWELEVFERDVFKEGIDLRIRFDQQVRRLKYECHQLHWDAYNLDDLLRSARQPTCLFLQQQANDIHRRMYILRNELGFAKGQLQTLASLQHSPPRTSGIFSSPSHDGSASPVYGGGGYSCSARFNNMFHRK